MPPFDAAYAAWPTWPSYAAMEAVLTMTPRWPCSSGSVRGDLLRRERQHVEGPDQVDPDDRREQLEVVHALLAQDPGRGADARAVHHRAQRAVGRGPVHRDLHLGRVGDVGGDVGDAVDRGGPVDAGGQVEREDPGAPGREGGGRRGAETRRPSGDEGGGVLELHQFSLRDGAGAVTTVAFGFLASARLITSRWIWLVPSKICITLASRM